jgi:hypothetical protein
MDDSTNDSIERVEGAEEVADLECGGDTVEDTRVIDVHDSFAIITARMKVREIAGTQGFNILDQARISLATSSLAYMLGLGGTHEDRIIISCIRDGGRVGIKVVCEKAGEALEEISPRSFEDTRWMVDELTIEKLPDNGGMQVIVVKWKGDIADV